MKFERYSGENLQQKKDVMREELGFGEMPRPQVGSHPYTCVRCRKQYVVTLTEDHKQKMMAGQHIQDAMPDVPATLRELFISGQCSTCYPPQMAGVQGMTCDTMTGVEMDDGVVIEFSNKPEPLIHGLVVQMKDDSTVPRNLDELIAYVGDAPGAEKLKEKRRKLEMGATS